MLRLRPFRPQDAATILTWATDEIAFYKWTAGVLGEYPISEIEFWNVMDNMAFAAIDDEELVGFFMLRRPERSFSLLRFGFVIVDPGKRGMGYGKAMLRLGMKYAKEIYGAKKVSLGVFENNRPAYYCYRAAGFTEIEGLTDTYHVLGEDWTCLELEAELEAEL